MHNRYAPVALLSLLAASCGGKTVLDEPGMYEPGEPAADASPDAKTDAGTDAKTDAKEAGSTWKCTRALTPQGPTCTCSDNPPAGESVDPAKCRLSYGYGCCQWDGKTCTCKQGYDCPNLGDAVLEQCGEVNLCPYPLVHPGDTCTKQGLQCPGEGNDSYCWEWRCSCGTKGFQCSPGVCS
jgi:hypothetical protein